MCKVSDKIKLCSCTAVIDDVIELDNYWLFYRFKKGLEVEILGELMLPVFVQEEDHAYNMEHLPKLLNDGNVFDIDLHPKPKDRLLLCLQIRLEDNTLGQYNYGFQYKIGKWVHCEYDSIEWMWKHIEEKGGNVKNHPTIN